MGGSILGQLCQGFGIPLEKSMYVLSSQALIGTKLRVAETAGLGVRAQLTA